MRHLPFVASVWLSPSLLVIALALAAAPAQAAGVAPTAATPEQRDLAQSHFARGHDLFVAKKFDEAQAEFEKSYAVVESPNALLFVARCDRERGKLLAAYAELDRTVREAREHAGDDPRYAKTAEAAAEERDAITPQLGFVTVTITGGSSETTVKIAGAKFARSALFEPLPVMPGSSEIIVETPGKAPLRQTLAVFGGERKTVTFDAGTVDATPSAQAASPAPLPPPHVATPEEEAAARDRLRTASYVSGGVAAVGFITLAVAGIAAANTNSNLQAECHGACPPGAGNQSQINQANTESTVADVGLVVGLVGAAAGVTFFVMSLPTHSDRVSVTVGPAWMGVTGRF